MEWFEDTFGFNEYQVSNVSAMFNLTLSGDNYYIQSKANMSKYCCGKFTTPSLRELRESIGNEACDEELRVEHIVIFDVETIHKPGATIQVASQLNCLEFPSPGTTPEDGISEYIYDNTQGPACALMCPGATVYRNYFVFDGQHQTADKQINLVADLPFAVHNGYVLTPPEGMALTDEHMGLVRIGWHENVEVSGRDSATLSHMPLNTGVYVNQCFCSALSCGYSQASLNKWEPYAQFILNAMYEGIILAAERHRRNGGSGEVYLTMLGGGAFKNKKSWIAKAMGRAIRIAQEKGFGLHIYVCHYCRLDAKFVEELSEN